MNYIEADGLLFGSEPMGGLADIEKIRNIAKSLGVDYTMGTTDQLGGAAVRHESLEQTLKNVEAREESAAFWKAVKKTKARAAVEEFAVLKELAHASSYPEFGLPEDQDLGLERGYEQIKLVGIIGKVSFFGKENDTIIELESLETEKKAVSMLRSLDVISIRGDAAKIPTEPNGIIKQAKARMKYPEQNVIDLRGKRIRPEEINQGGQVIADNYGNPANLSLWMSNQHWKDYTDELLAERRFMVGSAEATSVIASADKFKLGNGSGRINTDVFLKYREQTYLGALYPKLNAAKNAFATMSTNAPTQLDGNTATAAIADDTSGKNLLVQATYDYAIVPVNRFGAGKAFEITGITINAANKKVVFTLADNGSAEGYEATKFDIYRKLASESGLTYYKFLFSVAASATAEDTGYWIPGTSDVLMFDWDMDQVFTIKQLLPMVKLPLATIADYKWWLQKIYFSPIVFNGSKMVIFENVGSLAHSSS
ncbi:MAG: hypothetical protein A2V66_07170 [Ignavibacteria bacterium RBG_13_36_8]|nr:MAG: hypothetical protein A2V66_07170 [Ignavibacteria bacterium RBG_13_36_8]